MNPGDKIKVERTVPLQRRYDQLTTFERVDCQPYTGADLECDCGADASAHWRLGIDLICPEVAR